MRFADVFINNPVKVTSGVILLVLFGLLTIVPPEIFPSPIRVPVQLTPNIDEPVVSVSTFWEGASPEEVEREIEIALTGSSILNIFSIMVTDPIMIGAAMAPITTADHGSTKAAPAVMPTNPARAPLQAIKISVVPFRISTM